MHVCPPLSSFPKTIEDTVESVTRPLATMVGDLPPSSSVTGTRFSLAAFITARPTALLPVNTRWSSGREAKAEASPLTTVTWSSGKVSLIMDASSALVDGTSFDGFSITRFPAAIAVTTGISDRFTG